MTGDKFVIDLRGPDGNVYMVITKVCTRLKQMGEGNLAAQLKEQALQQRSYEDVLKLIQKFVQVEFIRD